MHTERLLDLLRRSAPDMFTTLEQLVRLESPSRDLNALNKILRHLKKEFNKLGYFAEIFPGKNTGGFLYARPLKKRKKQPRQLVIGHCDTVWKKDTLLTMPYKEQNEKIAGPGVYDMKAGITQILYGLKVIQEMKWTPGVLPLILINTDEEVGSIESKRTIARLAKISERAFVLEPPLGAEGRLKTERKGVGRFNLKVRGKAAHAGLDPEKGVNAIVELSHQIQKLYAMNDPEKGITVNVGMISGGVSPNVVAPESTAVIDVRVNNHKDGEWISEQILKLQPDFPGSELEITGGVGRPPMEFTSRNQLLWEKARQKGISLGLQLQRGKAGGGSDGNITSMFTATLDGLGTPGDGAHAEHEFVFKETLAERTALLTMLIMEPTIKELS